MSAGAGPLERRAALHDSRIERYRRMVEIRAFEDRVRDLFFEGLVHGTTHTCQGQEAVAVGLASVIRPTDLVACTYRGHGHALALGMTPTTVLGEIMGRLLGSVNGLGGSMHLSDVQVGLLPTFAIIGAGIPVAAGVGLTAQVRQTDDVGVAVFGDGASNIGAFHEGLNLASIWKLPVLFVCENNVYAEYSRVDRTTPIDDIADRAISYGIRGHVVDGQDVDEVAGVVERAVTEIRAGSGPILLEMKTYRYAGHSRADTAPYRLAGEFDEWYERDPINTFGRRLVDEGLLTDDDLGAISAGIIAELEKVVEYVSDSPRPTTGDMFMHVTADGPVLR